jgi:hypothetical protein
MPVGSHGNHCPAAPQPRACCQVDHETPMTVPVAHLAAQPACSSAVISDGHDNLLCTVGFFVSTNEFSPPPPAVLRI